MVRGGTSPVVDDEDINELKKRNPTAEVVVVEGAGHSVQGDRPIEMAELLRRFV
jgi:pimeloyl-ACP methyl ester carboxylesterase